MTLQFSVEVRNARLDAIETTVDTDPWFALFTGPPPANTFASNTGTLLIMKQLASDWSTGAASGQKGVNTFTANGVGVGIAGHFRLFKSTADVCYLQGTVSESGGGGDLIIDNASINIDQGLAVSNWIIFEGNP